MPGNPGSDLGHFTSRSASKLNKVLFNNTKFNVKSGKIIHYGTKHATSYETITCRAYRPLLFTTFSFRLPSHKPR